MTFPKLSSLTPSLSLQEPAGGTKGRRSAHGRSGDKPRAEEALDSVKQGLFSFEKSEGLRFRSELLPAGHIFYIPVQWFGCGKG